MRTSLFVRSAIILVDLHPIKNALLFSIIVCLVNEALVNARDLSVPIIGIDSVPNIRHDSVSNGSKLLLVANKNNAENKRNY